MAESNLAEEETIREKWKKFLLKENFSRITSRLKITQRLISLIYSEEIITDEDKEILESTIPSVKKQQLMLEMWSGVPEKRQALIKILKKDEFLLKPVANILEEFGKKKSENAEEESKAQPVQDMADTCGKAGESTGVLETSGTGIVDSILPVATHTEDNFAPDSENTVSLQAGGMAGNDFNAAGDIVSQTTSNSNNHFGIYNIQQTIFYNKVPPALLTSVSLAAATSFPAVQSTSHTYMEEVPQKDDASKEVKPSSKKVPI